MTAFLEDLWSQQHGLLDVEIWVEPFAGGAGAGLALLHRDAVAEVWLVEQNPALAALWRVITEGDCEQLADQIARTVPDMNLWHQSRDIVAAATRDSVSDDVLGFAALVLNRCSRSGIVAPRVGPIGGQHQRGRWHLASRWNGPRLADRVRAIGQMSHRIHFREGDGIEHVRDLDGSTGIEDEVFLFIDPPYLQQGPRLYAHGMTTNDHHRLAAALHQCPSRWMLTYDNDPQVPALYPDHRILAYEIAYTTHQRQAWEYAVLSHALAITEAPQPLARNASYWIQHGPGMQDPRDLFDIGGIILTPLPSGEQT